MSKHTPGPWDVSYRLGCPGAVKGGVTRDYARGSGKDQLFTVHSPQDDNGGDDAWHANARLIAAAPELLMALKLADALLSGANMNRAVVEREVRAAIAKGEGGQTCQS